MDRFGYFWCFIEFTSCIFDCTTQCGISIENGITIGFLVGDVKSAVDELKSKGVTIYRDIIEKDTGKNAIIQDPDEYLISLFEPIFNDKDQQTGGYHGFTPA